ncbi:alpha/beta fold hydrolase [Streptomyces candidus]|uniref:Pimeloyl-ACP methyl ester carboxylesterase n=1 Tax=Streptomyces candidus TaxID=67283 RepID=A0A7X0LS36_9ACTN|nr:alpha/beta hydrolase [Streptomyces candidus]MBB6438762.1 pimeloyl-ACP methyl ester carboxylesterase [Streptomyces candidus]GHH53086.1 alpha/beta hydrolase [Streptomyces candidus]
MQLHTHTWGEGDRIALLIHGIMADHRAWRTVGPALAGKGYRVIAVDLRGHGLSGRGDAYTPEAFADDLAETLPAGAELALGHSLGGLTLSLAVDRLRPKRAVYSDPAWHLELPGGVGPEAFAEFKSVPRAHIAAMNPRWDAEDVDVEVATLALWDEASALGLAALVERDLLPRTAVVPSLVQLADPSLIINEERAALLRARGFEVRTVKGAGHTIQRDDFDRFMSSLDGWI